MKKVCQLDENGYFVGITVADESPLEEGIYLLPYGTVDVSEPEIKDGFLTKWDGSTFIYEVIPKPIPEPDPPILTYADLRRAEYPPISDYVDGIVKGDQVQIDKYIADCLSVKAKYPKPIEQLGL